MRTQRGHCLMNLLEVGDGEAVGKARRVARQQRPQLACVMSPSVPIHRKAVLFLETGVPGDGFLAVAGRPFGPGAWPRHVAPDASARMSGTPLAPEISIAGSGVSRAARNLASTSA